MNRIEIAKYVGALLLICAGGAAFFVPPPTVDNSALVWVDSDTPAAKTYRAFQARFGADEVYAVRLSAKKPTHLPETIERFQRALEASPAVERVISAASVLDSDWNQFKQQVQNGEWARADTHLESPLMRALNLFRLQEATALVIGLSRLSTTADQEALEMRLTAEKREAKEKGITARVAGNPLINLELDHAGLQVEQVSMPILVAVCVVLLLVLTRSVFTTAATLLPTGVVVKGIESILGAGGISTNIVTNIAKPLLFVLLLAGSLHVVVGWQDALAQGVSRRDAPWRAVRNKGRGIFMALLTSAVGFGSLALSSVPPIRLFGLVSAGGLMAGALYVLVVLPSLLRFVPIPRHHGDMLASSAVYICTRSARFKRTLPAIALAIIGFGLYLSVFLSSDPHAIRYFKPDHPLRRDHEALERAGVGLAAAEVVIETSTPLMNAAGLRKLSTLADRYTSISGVKQVIDPSLIIKEALFRASLGPAAMGDDRLLRPILGAIQNRIRDFVSEDGKVVRLSLLIGALDAADLKRLHREIRTQFDAIFPSQSPASPAKDNTPDAADARLTITGNYEILLLTQAGLLGTLKSSLLLTIGLMTVLFLLFLKSVKITAMAMVPNLLPVSLNFIIMHYLGMPLDVGTSMTAAIALGIAVDDTLHFVSAWKTSDLGATAKSTGRAIILSSLIIAAGFSSLLGSDFIPTRNFGILCGSAMLSALVGDLIILPALLGWIRPSGAPRGAVARV